MMGVAALTESITVRGESPLVEVTKSQPSSVIVGEQLATLPVLDRNFLVLAQLMPGAAPLTGVSTRFAVTKFGGVADQRNGYTTIIDGGTVDDATWGSPVINMTQDAVQEFKVFRNQFDAAVRRRAQRRGERRLEVGHQQLSAAPPTTSAATRR